ncbi:MAG: acyl-CoA dehydrogenase family protein [Ahrensia sp.]|nr:acyl-CoA dehydrogenase family protein [Ahrensia sp.]
MTNQSPTFAGHNAYANDGVLRLLSKSLSQETLADISAHGQWVGSAEAQELARMANDNPPKLRTVDPKGERVDVVEFHPAYHALMRRGAAVGLNASIWETNEAEKGVRNVARAVRFMLTSQLENGHLCPLTMTNASVAPLLSATTLMRDWTPKIVCRHYDSAQRPPSQKNALTIGMGMTERQGGSDVRANTSRAIRGNQGGWRIQGEKWFFSAPMCDAFLILAQTEGGLSCFLIPRLLPDGTNNGIRLQRLKDKLGNRSNASSEVKFENTLAMLIGEEGAGVRTILEMVTLTRLDCSVGQAGLMRTALAETVHHTRYRSTFGKKLIDQPIMTRVLADLTLDVAAAQALSLRLARSFDLATSVPEHNAYARILTPAVKYWVCKIAPALIYECMESLGGNGYIEENNMPRWYREAPLNAIWEGSGNIMCLDVLRAIRKQPEMLQSVLDGLAEDLGDAAKQTIDVLHIAADMALEDEGSARIFTEQLALTAAAAEMRRSLPSDIAEAFIESRLGRPWRHTYGMMDSRYNARSIVDFAFLEAA